MQGELPEQCCRSPSGLCGSETGFNFVADTDLASKNDAEPHEFGSAKLIKTRVVNPDLLLDPDPDTGVKLQFSFEKSAMNVETSSNIFVLHIFLLVSHENTH
jgi:hypothetical protein